MQIIFYAIISIFAVLGIQYFIKELIKTKLNNPPFAIVCGYKDENEIEYTLRCILFEYPDIEIYVLKNDYEESPVLEKMQEDYPNIHINHIQTGV